MYISTKNFRYVYHQWEQHTLKKALTKPLVMFWMLHHALWMVSLLPPGLSLGIIAFTNHNGIINQLLYCIFPN